MFDGPDPISGSFPHLSTTNYAGLSPVVNIDWHGLQPVNTNGIIQNDQKGLIKSATSATRQFQPGFAFVQDATFAVADAFGLNTLDNAIADGNTKQIVTTAISVAFITKNGRTKVAPGANSRLNLKSGKTSRQGQFTEKTSLELDPPTVNPDLKASTVQRVNDFLLDPAPNSSVLRPGDPTGGPVVSGRLGKAAVVGIGGAVAIKAANSGGAGNATVAAGTQTTQIVPPADNTAVRIPIIRPQNQ